ncbi:MAG: HEAT repeat domain-containing protein, partial [Candidatus Latescibacteria bacterium]|nr:HEAT repeat domain-containing protein [Candidatus Latescibacterota bacterium]
IARPILARTLAETEGEMQNFIRRIIHASDRLCEGEVLCWTMRPATLATAVALDPESAVKVLSQNLHSGNRRESYHAARGLVYLGSASLAVLQNALQSPKPLVRRRASEALRDLQAPESLNALQAALDDSDVTVRINAVRGLTRIGHPQIQKVLASRTTDPSQAVRRAIREGLANTA